MKMIKKLFAFIICGGLLINCGRMPIYVNAQENNDLYLSEALDQIDESMLEPIEATIECMGFHSINEFVSGIRSSYLEQYRTQMVDLNDDGSCDSADAQIILQFILGNYQYGGIDLHGHLFGDLNDLDIDSNYIVDNTDVVIYMQFYVATLAGVIQNFTPIHHAQVSASENYERQNFYLDRTYKKCDLTSTGTIDTSSITTYALPWTVNSASLFEEMQSNTMRDRTLNPVFPSSCTSVVQLTGSGSGFIVGEHTIATAAHCIYNTVTESFVPVKIRIYDENMNLEEEIIPKSLHVPYEYSNYVAGNSTAPRSNYDYGLITVDDTIDLSDYGVFQLGAAAHDLMITSCPVSDCGFAIINNQLNRYQTQGNIVYWPSQMIDYNEYPFTIAFDVTPISGCSGAPIFTTIGDNSGGNSVPETVLGIVYGGAYGYGTGIRIMPTVLRFYYQNTNI